MDLVAAHSSQHLQQAATTTSFGGQKCADSQMASFAYKRCISDDMRPKTSSCALPCHMPPLSCIFQELAEREGAVQGGEARLRSLQHQLEAQEQQLANRDRTLQHQQEVSLGQSRLMTVNLRKAQHRGDICLCYERGTLSCSRKALNV